MTGRVIYQPPECAARHSCETPEIDKWVEEEGTPGKHLFFFHMGALWRCECETLWRCNGWEWEQANWRTRFRWRKVRYVP